MGGDGAVHSQALWLNAYAVLDMVPIVPGMGIVVVGRATVHPIAGAKVTAY